MTKKELLEKLAQENSILAFDFNLYSESQESSFKPIEEETYEVINVNYPLFSWATKPFSEKLKSLETKDNLETLILNINCPGGAVDEIPKIKASLNSLREVNPNLKIVSFIENIAASAGYWLACFTDQVFGNSQNIDSHIGGIGAYRLREDYSEKFSKQGIKINAYYTHSNKLAGINSFSPSEYEEEKIKNSLKKIEDSFYSDVAQARNISIEGVKALEAKTFDNEKALELKLIDKIVSFDELIEAVNMKGVNSLTLSYDMSKEKELIDEIALYKDKLKKAEDQLAELKAKSEESEKAKTQTEKDKTALEAENKKMKAMLDTQLEAKRKEAALAYQAFTGSELNKESDTFKALQSLDNFDEIDIFINKYKALSVDSMAAVGIIKTDSEIEEETSKEELEEMEKIKALTKSAMGGGF